jgi:sugar phosphate isomerase/epimerase
VKVSAESVALSEPKPRWNFFAKVKNSMLTNCLRASDGEPAAALLERAAAAQFQAVEFSFASQGSPEEPSPSHELHALREAADQAAIRIGALRIDSDNRVSFGDPSEESRRSAATMICGALDAAVFCGASIVVVPAELFRRKDVPRLPRDEAHAKLLDAFAQIRFYALHRGITVACDFCRSSAFSSVGETRGFVDWVNSPFVGVSIAASEDLGTDTAAAWIALLGHRVKHVSVGTTSMGLSAAVSALHAAHFDGVITFSGADAGALRAELSNMMGLPAAS